MNRILEMREKRGQIWDRAKAFLKEHQDENGMLSAEDAAEYERMEQAVVELGRVIDREERAAQMERELNAPTASPLSSRPEARPNTRPGRGSDEYNAKLAAFGLDGEHFTAADWLRPALRFISLKEAPDEALLAYLRSELGPVEWEAEKVSAGLYFFRFFQP